MPPTDEIEKLMTDLESDLIERKESIAADRMREAVCAFANDLPGHRAPGYLFVGVNDRGKPTRCRSQTRYLPSDPTLAPGTAE